MVNLKSIEVLSYLMSPKLREILAYIDYAIGNVTLTSLYRPADRGIHGAFPLRAIDIRCRNVEIGNQIAKMVNEKFKYDPERPEFKCAIPHGEESNFHLHLQVHRNTEKILRKSSDLSGSTT